MKPAKRKAVMERAGYTCELALLGCEVGADTVHHLVKKEWGGRNSLGNLRASCGACHRWVHANEDAAVVVGLLVRPGGVLPVEPAKRGVAPRPVQVRDRRCDARHEVWEFMRCTLPLGHVGRHRALKGVHGGQVPMVWGEDATSMLKRAARGPVELARHPLSRVAS